MKKLISYPISAIFYLIFFIFLCIFHPIQIICHKLFGYETHKKSVDILNFFLIKCTNLLGTTYEFKNLENIPENVPLIFVANHQSMYDIIAVIWYLRKYNIKFVSKKELGTGVPSVSYNLRNGGSVLIDRKDPKQAITEISKLGKYIEVNNRSGLIFPEGNRSKSNVPKKFHETGLKILCKSAPSAHVVPLSINNSWKIVKYGLFPLGLGNRLIFTAHKSMEVSKFTFEEIMLETEKVIVANIK